MFKVEINDEQFEEALLRHEKAFDKELEEIKTDEKELRKMILKMKKSIIEQSRQNNSTYTHAVDAIDHVTNLNRKIQSFENKLEDFEIKVKECTDVFTKAIDIMKKHESEKLNNKNYIKGLWEFIKNIWKS